MEKTRRIAIIGAGRTGGTLASCLDGCGYKVTAIASKTYASALSVAGRIEGCRAYSKLQEAVDNGDVVFITVPDDCIKKVTDSIKWRENTYVLHTSGAQGSSLLEKARREGAFTGVLHPLQIFSTNYCSPNVLEGVTFALEAETPLKEYLEEMINLLGGLKVIIKTTDKMLYHASAVMASNYLVTLLKSVVDIWSTFGIEQETALKAINPLVMQTLKNASSVGLPQALTGPISRGDTQIIKKHVEAITQKAPEAAKLYGCLGLETISLALENGTIDKKKAKEIFTILNNKTYANPGE